MAAEVVSDARVARMLEPWLGPGGAGDLPLPTLVDVRLAPNATIDLGALARQLGDSVPGATLDDHRRWLNHLILLGRSVELIAVVILVLIAAAAAATTVFGTRTALAVHRHVIEVMHLIGAPDAYIARQFQAHALGIGLRGGLTGLLFAVATLLAVEGLAQSSGADFLPSVAVRTWQWGALALLPVATALIARVTARMTVLRALSRMV